MPIRILMQEIEKKVELSAWEKETLENTGNIRWQSNIPHVRSAQSLSHVHLFVTPWTCSPPGFSVHGIFQVRILERVAISSS